MSEVEEREDTIDAPTELLLRMAFVRYSFGLDLDAATLVAGAELLGGPKELIDFFKGLVLVASGDHEAGIPLLEQSRSLDLPTGLELTRRTRLIQALHATGQNGKAQSYIEEWQNALNNEEGKP